MRGIAAGELRLVVRHARYGQSLPIPFAAGARDIRVVLTRGGRLTACLAEEDAHLEYVDMYACGPQSVETPRRFRAARDLDGFYEWTGLPAGTYDVSVELHGQQLKTIPGVEVIGGHHNRPAALQDLRVREGGDWVTLQFFGPDGQPCRARMVIVKDAATGLGSMPMRVRGDATRYTLYKAPGSSTQKIVEAQGYAPVRVDISGSRVRVDLKKRH